MNMKILSVVVVASLTGGLGLLRAEDVAPLPELKSVLKRVVEQVEKTEQNEKQFKQDYSYTRFKKTEYKNSDGEVKKTEEKTKVNNPLAKRVTPAPKPVTARGARPGAPASEAQANLRGKAYDKSDFPVGDDLINRFDFTLVRREVLNGRPVLVIDFKPAKKKLPENSMKEKFLNKAAGRAWVDEEDAVPVKADLHLSAPVSVLGGLVGAVQKFTFTFNRQRTPEGVWFTTDTDWHLEGREVFFRRIIDYHEETTNVTHVGSPDPNALVQQAR